jgi:hypothetical protein
MQTLLDLIIKDLIIIATTYHPHTVFLLAIIRITGCPITNGSLFQGSTAQPLDQLARWEVSSSMESSGLCLQYFIGMGNFPRNCQWMKLEIGNFEKIVLGNRFISLASFGKSTMFVDGRLDHKCSFPKMGLSFLWVVGCQT